MTLLPIGTRVKHFDGSSITHGKGTIVEYNGQPRNDYAEKNLVEVAELAATAGCLNGLVNSFYDKDRYPYVVQWDGGYKDVYGPDSLTEIVE